MILDEIAAKTKERIARCKEQISFEEMKAKALAIVEKETENGTKPYTVFPFRDNLAKPGISFICEVKKASPSKGLIAPDFPYLEIAKEYKEAGAAAISIARLLLTAGFKNITLCDRKGAIYEGRPEGMNPVKDEMAKVTNLAKKSGSLADMLVGADVFIGVSAPGAVTTEMVKTMNKDAIIFACANPTPEIFPDDAKAGGAKVVSTGRSDFPNQINNVLAFPGVFRGAFDVRASDINDEMKIAASEALANLITDEELSPEYIIPKAFDKRVGPAVAKAVAEAAKRTGVARI